MDDPCRSHHLFRPEICLALYKLRFFVFAASSIADTAVSSAYSAAKVFGGPGLVVAGVRGIRVVDAIRSSVGPKFLAKFPNLPGCSVNQNSMKRSM
jgi:hypothetical protein